jgi:hypothetical protein
MGFGEVPIEIDAGPVARIERQRNPGPPIHMAAPSPGFRWRSTRATLALQIRKGSMNVPGAQTAAHLENV